jgi:nitrogenase molybdenum-iron protein alpha chain
MLWVVTMVHRTHMPLTPTFIDGLLLVTNAVPDTALIIDCANCGADKFSMIGGLHDLGSSITHWSRQPRARFSNIRADDMVLGTEGKLRESLLELIAQRQPKLVFLVQSSAVQLIGSNHDVVAEDIEAETGVPIAVVRPQPLSGDWLDGVSAALEGLARRLELSEREPGDDAVGVVGYPFERFEQDHASNVRELRRILEAMDCTMPRAWLDGSDAVASQAIGRASTLLAMSSGRTAAAILAQRTGARVVECGLPMGIEGTSRWIRGVAAALGRREQAERFIERELDELVPRLERVVRRTFIGRSAAVIGGPEQVTLLGELLGELGIAVRLAVPFGRREHAADEVRRAMAVQQHPAEVLFDATFPEVEDAFRSLVQSKRLDFVIGSGGARDAAKALRLPYVEIGHPCYVRHALFDAPWLGYRGVLWIADTLFNMLHEIDYLAY